MPLLEIELFMLLSVQCPLEYPAYRKEKFPDKKVGGAMPDRDPLEEFADHYRQDGYEVVVRPKPDALPAFLANSEVLIFARKGREYLAIHPKPQEAAASSHELGQPAMAREPDAEYL